MVILDFSDTVYMDDSAALVVEQMIDRRGSGGTPAASSMGLTGQPADNLHAPQTSLRAYPGGTRFAGTLEEARGDRQDAAPSVARALSRPLQRGRLGALLGRVEERDPHHLGRRPWPSLG